MKGRLRTVSTVIIVGLSMPASVRQWGAFGQDPGIFRGPTSGPYAGACSRDLKRGKHTRRASTGAKPPQVLVWSAQSPPTASTATQGSGSTVRLMAAPGHPDGLWQ